MQVLVVATVTATGEPRTSLPRRHFLHGRWVFSTGAKALKARHIKARPAVSATYVDGERIAVFTHGRADYINRGLARLRAARCILHRLLRFVADDVGSRHRVLPPPARLDARYAADAESLPDH